MYGGDSPRAGGFLGGAGVLDPPPDCRRIVIVGAGGFGREVFQWARDTWPGRESLLGGFLSDDPRRLDGFSSDAGIVSSVRDYRPIKGDYLLLGIGVPYSRRRVVEQLESREGRFLTLVHPRAVVSPSASIGQGSVICPFALVSDSAVVGRFVLLNYFASLGHDASAADYCVLSPYAALGGSAHIGEDVFLGMHSTVGPGVGVGSRSKVSANSCALKDTPQDSIVYGVPGRISRHVDVAGPN